MLTNHDILRWPSLFFKEYLREVKWSAIFLSKKKKSVVSFMHEQNIIVVWEVNSYGQLKLKSLITDNWQLLDKVEQNIVICPWRVDELFVKAEGWGK